MTFKLWFIQLLHKKLGIQTLGLLVESEAQGFVKRLPLFLPRVQDCLKLNSKKMKITKDAEVERIGSEEDSNKDKEENDMEETKIIDQLLFVSLSTLGKICKECNYLSSTDTVMNEIWGEFKGQTDDIIVAVTQGG